MLTLAWQILHLAESKPEVIAKLGEIAYIICQHLAYTHKGTIPVSCNGASHPAKGRVIG